jgi:hypothetical protein
MARPECPPSSVAIRRAGRADGRSITRSGIKEPPCSARPPRNRSAPLVHRVALNRDIGPQRSQRRIQPRGAVDDDEFRRLQATFDKIVVVFSGF